MLARGGLEIRLQASESNMLSGYPPARSARELLSAHYTTTLNRKHHFITSFLCETPRTHVGTKLHTMASCTGLRRLQFFTTTTTVRVPTIAPAHPCPVATATATTTERRRRRRWRRSRRKARTTFTTVDPTCPVQRVASPHPSINLNADIQKKAHAGFMSFARGPVGASSTSTMLRLRVCRGAACVLQTYTGCISATVVRLERLSIGHG